MNYVKEIVIPDHLSQVSAESNNNGMGEQSEADEQDLAKVSFRKIMSLNKPEWPFITGNDLFDFSCKPLFYTFYLLMSNLT